MRRQGMIAVIAGFFFALMAATANAQPYSTYLYASPTGTNNECSQERPCTAQAAVKACQEKSRDICAVHLADGVYIDPAINIYYYRAIMIEGNCEAPQNVVLRATKPGGALIMIQDHAIGVLRCLALEASVPGAAGIVGRQHIIADYEHVIFGPMPGGTHVALTEFSIATCLSSVFITGDARVHANVLYFSKLNMMTCQMALPRSLKFDYFANASSWAVINADGASFTGPGATASKGIRCNNYLSVVNSPKNGDFPGDSGKCSSADLVQSSADLAEQVAGMNAKLNALRAEVDDVLHSENVQRRHDRLIAAIVLLAIISGGVVAYRRLADRKI